MLHKFGATVRSGRYLYNKRWYMEIGFNASEVHLWAHGGFFCVSFLFVFVLKSLPNCLVCVLQPCGHLLGKG